MKHFSFCPMCGSDNMVHTMEADETPLSLCLVCVPDADVLLMKRGYVTFRLPRRTRGDSPYPQKERSPVYVPEPCSQGRTTLMDMLCDELGYYPAVREPVREIGGANEAK